MTQYKVGDRVQHVDGELGTVAKVHPSHQDLLIKWDYSGLRWGLSLELMSSKQQDVDRSETCIDGLEESTTELEEVPMSGLRDAIEQALFTAIQDQPRGVGGQVVSFYGFEDMPLRLRKTIRDEADAVLAVLADPPEDVIERATEALRQDSYAVACPPWDALDEEHKAGWLARGRLTLRAAFGGEQE